jgi:uridine kinase
MKPLIIGVAGGTGSGKTTVARKIYESLHLDSAVFLDHDSYYQDLGHLPLAERKRLNFDHPDSLDNALLVEHLDALGRREAIEKPCYDFAAHTRTDETVRVVPRDVVLVEGIPCSSRRPSCGSASISRSSWTPTPTCASSAGCVATWICGAARWTR